jgi:hypothetical protein
MTRLPVVPENAAPPVLSLSPSARLMALYILAASRTGKSRLSGRGIVWSDYYFEIPQIVIDATGIGTIDNFLDKLVTRLQYAPKSADKRFLRRIKYVNMASPDYIVPFPLLYQTGHERSLLHIAERYINVIRLSCPALLEAQVQGFPPLHYIAVHTHIVLAALGLPITHAEDLLRHPEKWRNNGTFAEAIRRNPACAPSVTFSQDEFIPARPIERRRLLNPYFEKIFTFNLDVNLRCQFGALQPGIDWEEVEEEGLTILLDFREETDPDMRRFKLLWVFSSLYEHIKRRGRRERPLAITIDEFSAMAQKVTAGTNPLAQMLDEFIQQYLRGQNIWLTVAHQSVNQIDEQLRNTLFSLGTYIFGRAPMPEARILADVLCKRDPYLVKHWRKVWGSEPITDRGSGHIIGSSHFVLDHEPEFMSLEDQLEEAANRIAGLGLFQFLCRPALREGEVSQVVIPLSIANLDRDEETDEYQFPNYDRVARFRAALEAQTGIPAATILKELASCLPATRGTRVITPSPQAQASPPETRRKSNLLQDSIRRQHQFLNGREEELPGKSGSPKLSYMKGAHAATHSDTHRIGKIPRVPGALWLPHRGATQAGGWLSAQIPRVC